MVVDIARRKFRIHGKRYWWWRHRTVRLRRFWWSLPFVVDGWQYLSWERRLSYSWGWLWAWQYGRHGWQKCRCSSCTFGEGGPVVTRNKRGEWSDMLHGKGRGGYWVMCSRCGEKKYRGGSYGCDRCECDHFDIGQEWEDPGHRPSCLLYLGPEICNYAKAMEFGGNPVDWIEVWWCPVCRNVYSFENSNC